MNTNTNDKGNANGNNWNDLVDEEEECCAQSSCKIKIDNGLDTVKLKMCEECKGIAHLTCIVWGFQGKPKCARCEKLYVKHVCCSDDSYRCYTNEVFRSPRDHCDDCNKLVHKPECTVPRLINNTKKIML